MISKKLEEYFIDAHSTDVRKVFEYLYEADKKEFTKEELIEAIGLNKTPSNYRRINNIIYSLAGTGLIDAEEFAGGLRVLGVNLEVPKIKFS